MRHRLSRCTLSKAFSKSKKVNVKLSPPLCALLYDVTQGEDLVCTSLSFPKPCLLSSQLLVHCVGYSLDDDLGQDLAGYR